jgi:hypothetical protein
MEKAAEEAPVKRMSESQSSQPRKTKRRKEDGGIWANIITGIKQKKPDLAWDAYIAAKETGFHFNAGQYYALATCFLGELTIRPTEYLRGSC